VLISLCYLIFQRALQLAVLRFWSDTFKELEIVVLHVVPQTAVLGAILLTGVFGGAIVTNLRVGDPSGIVPLILGLIVWGGLWFREWRLRELIPVRK